MVTIRVPEAVTYPKSGGQSLADPDAVDNPLFTLCSFLDSRISERDRGVLPGGGTYEWQNVAQQGPSGELLDWTAVQLVVSQDGEVERWQGFIEMDLATLDVATPAYLPNSLKNTGTEEAPVWVQMTWREWSSNHTIHEHDKRGTGPVKSYVSTSARYHPLPASVLVQLAAESAYEIVSLGDYQANYQPLPSPEDP